MVPCIHEHDPNVGARSRNDWQTCTGCPCFGGSKHGGQVDHGGLSHYGSPQVHGGVKLSIDGHEVRGDEEVDGGEVVDGGEWVDGGHMVVGDNLLEDELHSRLEAQYLHMVGNDEPLWDDRQEVS